MDETFWEDYRIRAQQVQASSYKTFSDRLRRWLLVLTSDPIAARAKNELEQAVDFDSWLKEGYNTQGSMIGSADLIWPEDESARYGMHLKLFERWSSSPDAALDFALTFFGISEFDEGIGEIVQQIFAPFAEDFEIFLKRRSRRKANEPQLAPASDRIVSLDHNNPNLKGVRDSISAVAEALRVTNDYDDVADKEQQMAELRAGQILLDAPRARMGAIKATLVHCLKYLGEKFADSAIGVLVGAAITALAAYFGFHIL